MIHAFVQRLRCGDHLIVRAGPLATEHGKPYRKSCLGEIDGDSVTLMAFCEPWWVQFLRRWFPRLVGSLVPYVRASTRALIADGFKKVHLDRLGNHPRSLVITQGDEGDKAMNLKLTMTITGDDGSPFAETAQTYHNMGMPDVYATEKGIVDTLMGLGLAKLQSQTAPAKTQ